MTATYGLTNTSTADLGPHTPKPTALTPGLTEAAMEIWEQGKISTGLWECGVGEFSAVREGYTEICTILAGQVEIAATGEEWVSYGPGDIVVMPSGWQGVWRVLEPVRKHYTIITD